MVSLTGGRQYFALWIALGCIASIGCGNTAPDTVTNGDDSQSSLNIVLLIGDDHAWPHAGFLDDPIAMTPNLDRLARDGTAFHSAQNTASKCAPSLKTMLSGLHPLEWEKRKNQMEMELGQIPRRSEVQYFETLPRILARAGYVSFEGGKMWEGTFTQAGFTHGMATSIGSLYESVGEGFGREGIEPFRQFLDENGGQPFLAWLAPKLPHYPFDAPDRYRRPFEGRGLGEGALGYFANLLWMDSVVGEILDELQNRDLAQNTLVVYLSDNGWFPGQFDGPDPRGKSSLYEIGVRTSLIFRLPGPVPAGVLRDDLVSSLDLVPTLLSFAGAAPPPELEGRDLRSGILEGAPVGASSIVSEHARSARAPGGVWVRTPDWRYIRYEDGREELYAIRNDPWEEFNVAAERPDLVSDLRAIHADWRRQFE